MRNRLLGPRTLFFLSGSVEKYSNKSFFSQNVSNRAGLRTQRRQRQEFLILTAAAEGKAADSGKSEKINCKKGALRHPDPA